MVRSLSVPFFASQLPATPSPIGSQVKQYSLRTPRHGTGLAGVTVCFLGGRWLCAKCAVSGDSPFVRVDLSTRCAWLLRHELCVLLVVSLSIEYASDQEAEEEVGEKNDECQHHEQ